MRRVGDSWDAAFVGNTIQFRARMRVQFMDEPIVRFRDEGHIGDIAARPEKDTALKEWYSGNSEYPEAAIGVNYRDSAKYFPRNTTMSKRTPRKRSQLNIVGRM